LHILRKVKRETFQRPTTANYSNSRRPVDVKIIKLVKKNLGIITAIILGLTIGIAMLVTPDYDITIHTLSYLGSGDHSDYPSVFNYGLIIVGLLGAVFSFSFLKITKNSIGKFGILILMTAFIGVAGVGIFPAILDDVANKQNEYHGIAATIATKGLPIGFIVFGIGLAKQRNPLGYFSILLGSIGSIELLQYVVPISTDIRTVVIIGTLISWLAEKKLIQSTIDEQTGKLTVAYFKKG